MCTSTLHPTKKIHTEKQVIRHALYKKHVQF